MKGVIGLARYMIFAYDRYYPSGGLNDLLTTFESIEDIDFEELDVDFGYFQLFDTVTFKEIGIDVGKELMKIEEQPEIPWDQMTLARIKILKGRLASLL